MGHIKRVGISYWGICAKFEDHKFISLDTPDGHRYGRSILIDALKKAECNLYAMQERREPEPYKNLSYCYDRWNLYEGSMHDEKHFLFPELDVLFLEWRWSTYKNDPKHPKHDPSKFEPDLQRQLELIEYYRGKCPIIVWDTDLKVTLDDEERWPDLIWTDPSLETNRLKHKRVSLPFWTNFEELIPISNPYPVYGYVGNNYERDDEFAKFFFSPSPDLRWRGIQTSMYGNWLQPSPERTQPKVLITQEQGIAFNHRMNFFDSMQMMNKFLCTTHVSKPRYYETKFMSPRYLEALAVNCPALTPREFKGEGLLGEKYVVNSDSDVISSVLSIQNGNRNEIVSEQRENLKKHGKFDVKEIVSFIKSV